MHLLLDNWSYDPSLIPLVAVAALHLFGHFRHVKAARRRGRATRDLHQQAVLFQAGLVVLAIAIFSPIDAASDRYLLAHMVQHIILMFFAPPLVVLGAPWLPFLWALPPKARRVYGSAYRSLHRQPTLSAVRRFLTNPATSIVAFGVDMIFWHFPGPYDLAVRDQAIHILFEHGSFFLLGIAFWLQMVGSRPFSPVWPPIKRAWALVGTNVVMIMIAMTLALFTNDLYSAYADIPGRVMSQMTDQQLAGATLWVCGDFTIAPALYVLIARWLRDSEHDDDDTIDRIRQARARAATARGT